MTGRSFRVRRSFADENTRKDRDFMPSPVRNLVHTDVAALVESTGSVQEGGSTEPGAHSSVGERPLHTRKVVGSTPTAPTTPKRPRTPRKKAGEKTIERAQKRMAGGQDAPRQRNAHAVREVYFIRAAKLGLIKIGVANYVASRIVAMQTDSPDKLELLGVVICSRHGSLEGTLHIKFAHLRQHGEWFEPGEDLLAYIAENARDVAGASEDRQFAETMAYRRELKEARAYLKQMADA